MAQDWGTAFDVYARAILFIWPERAEEIYQYKEHINGFFYGPQLHEHVRLINYDKAMHAKFYQTGYFLLHQRKKYSDLKDLWLGGAQSITTPATKSVNLSIRQDDMYTIQLCNKFNAGTCLKTKRDCCYQHVCKDCL